jgi:xanthine/CO dehydrogenase XdhC/CoxF family maturation factor
MKRYAALLLAAAALAACSRTVVVPMPPKMDLKEYGPVGIVDFSSNSEPGFSARATRQFQEQVQSAQPGTRFVELGERQQLLAAVGAKQLDAPALRKIGTKYGVSAVFIGELAYSEPRTDVRVSDIAKLEGGARTEIRGDLSARLLETASGASVWSTSGWARRQMGAVHVSAERGVSGGMNGGNPREEMVPALVSEITHDFRPTYVRQPVR